jgi:hypothetical protein
MIPVQRDGQTQIEHAGNSITVPAPGRGLAVPSQEGGSAMKRRIPSLVFVCFGLALPASPATYNYLLQFGAESQSGAQVLAPYSVAWQSNGLLNPTACGAGIDLSLQPGFSTSGSPAAGYSPLTTGGIWTFCSNGGVPQIQVLWSNGTTQIGYYLSFSATSPPFTTGVFSPSDLTTGGTSSILTGPFPGPPVTLTITEALSFPPIPSWLGSIIRVSLTVAGPVTPLPGLPVEAIVGFVNLNGNPIGQSTPVALVAGQVSSVELSSASFVTQLDQHMEIVPVVSAPQGQLLPAVQLTAEVFDRLTGFGGVLTTVNGLAPPPASLAPQGLAGEQIMRLVVSAIPPDPCVATLSFANSQGAAIGPNVAVNLSPGQSTTLDLTSAALNLKFGQQMVVQPLVTLQTVISAAAAVSPACAVTSDVFDTILGRTWTYQFANVQ